MKLLRISLFYKIVYLLCLIFCFTEVFGQNLTSVKALKIGDKIPDIFLGKALNYSKNTIKSSDLKSKLTILDFWNTHCAVCIRQFPKLHKIQEEFKDQLSIMTVGLNFPGMNDIEEFVLRKGRGTRLELNLPTVIIDHDSELLKLFPNSSMPHEVWIDSNRIVVAITDHRAVTTQNIKRFLTGEKLNIPEKKVEKSVAGENTFLISKPANIGSSSVYGSLFSKKIENYRNEAIQILKTDTNYRIYCVNQSVLTAYQHLYAKNHPWLDQMISNARIIFEDNDKPFFDNINVVEVSRMDNFDYARYEDKNRFCYESYVPNSYTEKEVYQSIVSDFDKFFSIRSVIEKRKVKCFVIVGTPNISQILAAKGRSNPSDGDSGNLVQLLDKIGFGKPILDETEGKLDLITVYLPITKDLAVIQKCLLGYGLKLVETEREIDVLVLYNLK